MSRILEQHHPIMDKLGDTGVQTYRQTDSTPDSSDTQKAYIPYYYVVDTMVYDIQEEMELKNGKICDDSDASCAGNMKWMTTLNLFLMPLKKTP